MLYSETGMYHLKCATELMINNWLKIISQKNKKNNHVIEITTSWQSNIKYIDRCGRNDVWLNQNNITDIVSIK